MRNKDSYFRVPTDNDRGTLCQHIFVIRLEMLPYGQSTSLHGRMAVNVRVLIHITRGNPLQHFFQILQHSIPALGLSV